MRPYRQSDYDQKDRELRLKVIGQPHLYIEYCDNCDMPFILSKSSYQYKTCEDCRIRARNDKIWQNKVKKLKEEGLLV